MKKSSLLVIFLVVFIDLVGFGIVIPILPYYAQAFGATGWVIGWIMTIYSLMQFLVAPVWGKISDRIGRRPVLLTSLLGTGISMAVLGHARSIEWIFIGRLLGGICGANISTAYAYISDITTEKNRAKGMGLIGAAFGLGFIFGPAIGGLLAKQSYSYPMYFGAALALANFVLAFFVLGEPIRDATSRAANRSRRFDLATTRRVLSQPATRHPIILFFLFTTAVTQMEVVFAIYLRRLYGFDARQAGILLAATGLIMAGIQGSAIGKLARRFGELKLVLMGALICATGLFFFGLMHTLIFTIISLCVMAIGHGILHPSLSSLTSLGARPSERGLTMGVFHSASSFARVIGPPCAGALYDWVDPRMPFLFGACLIFTVFGFTRRWRKTLSSS